MIDPADPAVASVRATLVESANYRHDQAARAAAHGHFRHAARLLREVVEIVPEHAGSWAELGAATLWATRIARPGRAERFAEAKAALRQALRLDPDNAIATSVFAMVCGHERHRAASLILHRRAVAPDSTDAAIWTRLAVALMVYGDLDAAEDAYRRATAQLPGSLEVAEGLVSLLLLRGRHEAAWRELDRATLWVPDESWVAPFWGTWPAAPVPAPTGAPAAAPERPQVARQAARSPFAGLPPEVAPVVAGSPAPAPRPHPQPAPASRANVDRFLSMTPLGQSALRARQEREREAAARKPPPISAEVRRGLEATHLGRQVLADRHRRDPEGEAQAAGFDPARRRELLEASPVGRSILREEARR